MLNWKNVVGFATNGNPVPDKRVERTEQEWKAILTAEQFYVTRKHGTESPFSHELCRSYDAGLYSCVCCNTLLFDSTEKFESRTGWPSFTQPIQENSIKYIKDGTLGMIRIEAQCNVCDAHLGHVFPDGPVPTGLRYCMNGEALIKEVKQNSEGVIIKKIPRMQAIILVQPGSTSNLVMREINTPQIGDEEVLVQVKSVSINPVDAKTRQGGGVYNYGSVSKQSDLILGWDISGIVTASNSTRFGIGDEVFGMVNFPGVGSAYAEYVAAPAEHLALKPANISHQEAAAATLAPLTALQVFREAGVKAGDRILIYAASGGVGHYAIQLAKEIGAYVIGTSSASNRNFVLSLGADEHFNYQEGNLAEDVHDIDLVFDSLGPDNIIKSLPVIKNGGKVISIVTQFSEDLTAQLAAKNVSGKNLLVQSSAKDMEYIATLLANEKLKSHISKSFTFDQMADAHHQIETGRTIGKIVVNI